MNTLIPNTYQKPNWYSDEVDWLLTPEESKVLDFFCRRILGFEGNRPSRRDRISLSQITDGIHRADGSRLSYGTGLSRPRAVAAIKGLCDYGLVARIGKPTEDGQEYELVFDVERIDLPGLRARREQGRAAGRERTEKARAARAPSLGFVDVDENTDEVVCQSDSQNPPKTQLPSGVVGCADAHSDVSPEPPPARRPSRKGLGGGAPPLVQFAAPPPPTDDDDSHRAVCAAIVVAVVGDDVAARKRLWEGHRGVIVAISKRWRAADGAASSFEAEYGAGGRWYTLPCKYAVVDGKATRRPNLVQIAETLGQLDGYQHWDAARIVPRPRPVVLQADARPMSDEEAEAQRRREVEDRERRAAETRAAMPEHFRRRLEARQAERAAQAVACG